MSATALRIVEGSSMDKTKALSAALSQIERQFGKGSVMKLGKNDRSMDVETISSGSLGLDIALGVGGLPRGRVVEIYGPESSGKTTLALHTVAEGQKKGGICAFIDAEHALDPVYARKLGVQAGIVEKSGAWFSYDSQRLGQGRENSKAFLKANPDMTAKIEAAIRQNSGLIAEQILAGSPERDAEGEEPAEE